MNTMIGSFAAVFAGAQIVRVRQSSDWMAAPSSAVS